METQWSPLKHQILKEEAAPTSKSEDVYCEFNELVSVLGDSEVGLPTPMDALLPAPPIVVVENNQAPSAVITSPTAAPVLLKQDIHDLGVPQERELLLQSVQALTNQIQTLASETKLLAQEELTLRGELERVANQVDVPVEDCGSGKAYQRGAGEQQMTTSTNSSPERCKYIEVNNHQKLTSTISGGGGGGQEPRVKNQYSQYGKDFICLFVGLLVGF